MGLEKGTILPCGESTTFRKTMDLRFVRRIVSVSHDSTISRLALQQRHLGVECGEEKWIDIETIDE